MKVGIHIVSFAWPDAPQSIPSTLGTMAERAEEIGCSSVSVMDHYFQMEDFFPVDEEMLEGYTVLGFLAARTQSAQLRVLVTGVTYRHPGLLAKIVTTLDVLSGGRGELGIGSAWYEREHMGLGVPFPEVGERFERLEEALQICLQMWSDNNGPYDGKHYQLKETLCVPQPISAPRPPILIGGGGERRTLRLVAKYGDACNLFTSSTEDVAHKLDVLRRHCSDVGRDYDTIEKTVLYTGETLARRDTSAFLGEMREYARLGIESVFVMPVGPEPLAFIERLSGDPISRLAEL
jgi:F420-dependent oxidoreductase-like protein